MRSVIEQSHLACAKRDLKGVSQMKRKAIINIESSSGTKRANSITLCDAIRYTCFKYKATIVIARFY